ncbi:hypothetical protein BH23ACT10_BH23ACT10_34600 [soil metagenome]
MIEDLPVAVVLPAPLADRVTAWVEHDLGWQVVDPGGSLAPALVLADEPCGAVPWIAVTDGPPADDRVTAQLTAGAEDVVGWPDDRDRIPLIAARVDLHRDVVPRGLHLSVGGVAGGVGTSTVALAIGGLLAWAGAAVLVVGGHALRTLAGTRQLNGVGHAPVAGVPQLSVAGHAVDVATVAWTGDVVVSDAGTRITSDTTVAVARPDGGLRRARGLDVPVIVVGDQPLRIRDVERVLGRRPVAHLPWSVRVARAGLLGHVPSALPGRWLDSLRDGLGRVDRWPS